MWARVGSSKNFPTCAESTRQTKNNSTEISDQRVEVVFDQKKRAAVLQIERGRHLKGGTGRRFKSRKLFQISGGVGKQKFPRGKKQASRYETKEVCSELQRNSKKGNAGRTREQEEGGENNESKKFQCGFVSQIKKRKDRASDEKIKGKSLL